MWQRVSVFLRFPILMADFIWGSMLRRESYSLILIRDFIIQYIISPWLAHIKSRFWVILTLPEWRHSFSSHAIMLISLRKKGPFNAHSWLIELSISPVIGNMVLAMYSTSSIQSGQGVRKVPLYFYFKNVIPKLFSVVLCWDSYYCALKVYYAELVSADSMCLVPCYYFYHVLAFWVVKDVV